MLFLDSSVVLGYVVQQHKTKLDKLSADITALKLVCGVTDSVESECNDKIKDLTEYLGTVIMGVIGVQVSKQRATNKRSLNDPVDRRDILAMELAFRDMYSGKRNILDLQTVEIFMENGLEAMMKSPKPPNYYDAIQNLTALVIKYMTEVRVRYDTLIAIGHTLANPYTVAPDAKDVTSLQLIGLEFSDAQHVASALQAQRCGKCKKAVFVCLDYRTVLKYQIDILNKLAIWCTDPLYAAHHC